jgi:hypothetical protein
MSQKRCLFGLSTFFVKTENGIMGIMASEAEIFAALGRALAVIFEKQPCRTSGLIGQTFVAKRHKCCAIADSR